MDWRGPCWLRVGIRFSGGDQDGATKVRTCSGFVATHPFYSWYTHPRIVRKKNIE